ncbi:MAG: hypothetical protein M0Q92_08600 [Methanoregula sp.]|jgi:hypothetical protein|nr:hypothetical protein [Methanoregula sp.]
MAIESFKQALRVLRQMPLLWIPGIMSGLFLSGIWLLFNFTGMFFVGRLVILFGLVLLVFIVGMLVLLRDNSGDIRSMLHGAIQYYFRVLIPFLVITFNLIILFFILMVTFGFAGIATDPGTIGIITICVMIPTIMLTFFFDMAAVFEDKKVFESVQRSIILVSENVMNMLLFYIVSALTCGTIIFGLMIAWEVALFDKLEPLTRYTETQMAALTPEELMGFIGTDGIWVTAIVLFIGALILVPLLTSYKACFFKKITAGSISIQQETGEFDSKGRWYKY